MRDSRVALVHHWLVKMRGGEKVFQAMAELWPDADVFTLVSNRNRLSKSLRRRRIRSSWLDRLPGAHRVYPNLLPLYPAAVKSMDARGFDLVLSSDSSLVKGLPVSQDALHICYCYTPPRYLFDRPDEYLGSVGGLKRFVLRSSSAWLRRWDRAAARRVDWFVTSSDFVRDRIRRHYDREATVIHPPVDAFPYEPKRTPDDFYLLLGEMTPYKRADIAVEAMSRLGRRLLVIGEGSERARLERIAGPSVEFLGWRSDEEVRRRLASCRALLFPGVEDFGIVPVEAQMAGRPVIAFREGGALETVVENRTGVFFDRQEKDSLVDAVLRFEKQQDRFVPENARAQAMKFEKKQFLRRFRRFVEEKRALSAERGRSRPEADRVFRAPEIPLPERSRTLPLSV